MNMLIYIMCKHELQADLWEETDLSHFASSAEAPLKCCLLDGGTQPLPIPKHKPQHAPYSYHSRWTIGSPTTTTDSRLQPLLVSTQFLVSILVDKAPKRLLV